VNQGAARCRPFFLSPLMRKSALWLVSTIICPMAPGTSLAQELVWRCDQTMTNRLPEDEALRRHCVPVSLPKVTTLPAPRFAPAVPPQSPSAGTPGLALPSAQVDAQEQRQRDQVARNLLLAEKQKAQTRLQMAERSGDVAAAELARADLASLERELARRP
jgi:hypothetical protein